MTMQRISGKQAGPTAKLSRSSSVGWRYEGQGATGTGVRVPAASLGEPDAEFFVAADVPDCTS